MNKNIFIVFEGIDGSGKSTQASMLQEALNTRTHSTHLTFEPTHSAIGSLMRSNFGKENTFSEEDLPKFVDMQRNLAIADRLEHLYDAKEGILEKLKTQHVICDRYHMSTLVYQYVDEYKEYKNPKERFLEKCNAVINQNKIVNPDLTIYCMCNAEVAFERLQTREELSSFETLENLKALQERYEILMNHKYWHARDRMFPEGAYRDTDTILIVDAHRPVQEIHEIILGRALQTISMRHL